MSDPLSLSVALSWAIGRCDAAAERDDFEGYAQTAETWRQNAATLRRLQDVLDDPSLTMVCDHSSLSDPVFVHSSSDDLCDECAGCKLAALIKYGPGTRQG